MENKKLIFLSLLSGKGGSGKTVLSLSFAKVLSEVGVIVLFVDLDTATHGATYFFESELDKNNLCLIDILTSNVSRKRPLKTKDNFYFIPSTLNPEKVDIEYNKTGEGFEKLFDPKNIGVEFDVVIFDCQAGYSDFAKKAAEISHQNLIILEPDAVSSSALRVLHLQIGKTLNRSNSWQLFNKLTEEERPVYEKVLGGTLFSSLPPIPFDWQVRASFSTCEIPSVTERKSAFGLGVLRIMKIIFKEFRNRLEAMESKTGGGWFVEIKKRLKDLEDAKAYYDIQVRERRYRERLKKTRVIYTFLMILALSFMSFPLIEQFVEVSIFFTKFSTSLMGLIIMAVGIKYYFWNLKDIKSDREEEEGLEQLNNIESEMNKYKTLLTTDPWLKEYSRLDELQEKENNESMKKPNKPIAADAKKQRG